MTKRKIYAVVAIGAALSGALLSQGCVVSGHAVGAAQWGSAASVSGFEATLDVAGPIQVESIAAASWQVPLSGMVNLEHPTAQAAGLEDSEQPISIYFHALRHPTRGLFIVDSGVEHALANDPQRAAVRGFVAKLAKVDTIKVHIDLKTWLARQPQPLAGVLLTHMHLDHIMGIPDVPRGTPIFTGPGEARAHGALNLFTRPITDRVFAGQAPIGQWQFQPDPKQRFTGVLDVLGDGSLWALHVPGHSPGSTAYVARTPQGPVLMAGDACHTAWGWEHGVEPGTFSKDVAQSAHSLAALQGLAKRHPRLDVRLGHHSRGQRLIAHAKAQ